MKFSWILFSALICIVLSTSFSTKKKTTLCCVYTSSLNILYSGITNPIDITVDGCTKEDLIITTNDLCSIIDLPNTKNTYLVDCNGKKRETKIRVQKKGSNGKHTLIGQWTFRIRELPILAGQLGGIKNGISYPKAAILAQRSIQVSAGSSFPYHLNTKVVSYKLMLYNADEMSEYSDASDTLTDDMIFKMGWLKSGDFLAVTDINYTVTSSVDTLQNLAHPIFIPIK